MGTEKTPVTILNEMMSKIKSTVVYELGPSELNSNPPVFTCKVFCDGITALGSGRSKKEAKQNAAQIMLGQIKKRTVIIQSSTHKPSSESTDVTILDNAVKDLQKLCSKYEFEEPVFKDLDATGPPHACDLSVQCSVSTLTVIGIAKTKKQAKVDAAHKMMKKLQDTFCMDNLSDKDSIEKMKKIDKNEENSNNISKSTYKKSTNKSLGDQKLKINYNFSVLGERKELMKNSQNLALALSSKVQHLQNLVKECQQNINEKTVKKVKHEFQNMLESVNIDFHHMILQTADPITYMLIIQLNTIPDVLEMSLGATREEAELRTISKVIESLSVLVE